jgi:outer membrane lipoprotein-sorting protein
MILRCLPAAPVFALVLLAPLPVRAGGSSPRLVPSSYDLTLIRSSAPGTLHDPNLSVWPHLPLYPGFTSLRVRVRWDSHMYPEAGGRFREEDAWIVRPPNGYSSLARLTTAPLPSVLIFDGRRLGMYDPSAQKVAIYREQVSWPATEGYLRQFAVYGSLTALRRGISSCRSVTLRGTSYIAGRATYVIAFGQSHCRPPAGARDQDRLFDGPMTVWIDAATFFTLREDQYAFNHPHQLVLRTEVQSIRYNLPLPSGLFRVAVPPGYTVTHKG